MRSSRRARVLAQLDHNAAALRLSLDAHPEDTAGRVPLWMKRHALQRTKEDLS